MLLYWCGDYCMKWVLFFILSLGILSLSSYISDKLCIVLVIILLIIDVKWSERYIEDNSYDSNKKISRHIRFAKRNFVVLMISIISCIYITISLSLASSRVMRSYKRGIECCSHNNGTIDGYYCIFNYRNKVSIKNLDNEESVEYKAYCLKDKESLKELRPYDWQNYVDE